MVVIAMRATHPGSALRHLRRRPRAASADRVQVFQLPDRGFRFLEHSTLTQQLQND
jgi:hypothetical protein